MDNINSTLIIAEAGVNHNGDIDSAKRLIDCAAASGADVVKFQTFIADQTATAAASKADYQLETTEKQQSQLEMLRTLELNAKDHAVLVEHCERKSIAFSSTAFDLPSLEVLTKINPPFYKIPSGEITNLPLIRAIGRLQQAVILSTGASTLKEVETAVNVLQTMGNNNITLLHCTTQYPADKGEVNLRAMLTIGEKLDLPYGYSDHTMGIEIAIAAVAMGASVIEKHFTLDRNMPGPDHQASLEPDELAAMISAIRNVEKALGDGIKQPGKNERKNIPIIRRSIVASRNIASGEKLDEQNLTVKRPAGGRSPMEWDQVVGTLANKNYQVDELID